VKEGLFQLFRAPVPPLPPPCGSPQPSSLYTCPTGLGARANARGPQGLHNGVGGASKHEGVRELQPDTWYTVYEQKPCGRALSKNSLIYPSFSRAFQRAKTRLKVRSISGDTALSVELAAHPGGAREGGRAWVCVNVAWRAPNPTALQQHLTLCSPQQGVVTLNTTLLLLARVQISAQRVQVTPSTVPMEQHVCMLGALP